VAHTLQAVRIGLTVSIQRWWLGWAI